MSEANTGIFMDINFSLFSRISVRQVLLNILLSIPFGFAIFFITKYKKYKVILFAALFGIIIEGLQLVISLFVGFDYRIVDINDVFFNFIGSIIGFIIFRIFTKVFISIFKKFDEELNVFLGYIMQTCKECTLHHNQ